MNMLDLILVNQIHSRLSPGHYRMCVCCLQSPRVRATPMPSGMRSTAGPGGVWCSWRGRVGTCGTGSIPWRSASMSVENTIRHLVRHLFRYGFDSRARRCLMFVERACGDLRNRFDTMEECQYVCGKHYQAPGKTFISVWVWQQGQAMSDVRGEGVWGPAEQVRYHGGVPVCLWKTLSGTW